MIPGENQVPPKNKKTEHKDEDQILSIINKDKVRIPPNFKK